MLNPTAWNWQNFAGFFWVCRLPLSPSLETCADSCVLQAGSCFLCFVYTFFRLPEPRGRTFAELDVLFEHRIVARKFENTHVDVWQEEIDGHGVMNSYQEKVAASHVNEKV